MSGHRARLLVSLLAPLALCGVLAVALHLDHSHGGLLEQLELASYDLRFQVRGPLRASDEILIVYVDDESMRRLDLRSSTPGRDLFAKAIDQCLDGGATVVGLDYVFSSADPSRPDDKALLDSVAGAEGAVVLACFIARADEWEFPAPALMDLEEAPAAGFINYIADLDSRVRRMRYQAYRLEDGELREHRSFALRLFWIHKDIPHDTIEPSGPRQVLVRNPPAEPGGSEERYTLPVPDGLVNYVGPARSFRHVSFWEVVQGKVDPALYQGRAVLIGDATTTRGGSDFILTPFTQQLQGKTAGGLRYYSEEAFPGVDYHAAALQTILDQSFLHRSDYTRVLIASVLLSLLLGLIWCWPRTPAWATVLSATVLLGGLVVASQWLFVNQLLWLDVVVPATCVGGQMVLGVGLYVVRLVRQRREISSLFGRYVSQNYVKLLLERVQEGQALEELLVGSRQEATVMFTDVRGFTSLSEAMDPAATAALLKRYFNEMTRIVREDYEGTMDKLLGDGLMAFFNAPLTQADHPVRACLTALSMLEAVDAMVVSDLLPAHERLVIGVGINSGHVIVGDLGSDTFADYTVLGDTVNLAARLEALNKEYGTRIIISEHTHALVASEILCRRLDQVQVRGRQQLVSIFEVLSRATDATDTQRQLCEAYETGLKALRAGEMGAAAAAFDRALQVAPDDRPSQLMRERAAATAD